MPPIQHIFFDLDHTLWDFDKNSKETLKELFFDFNFQDHIASVDDFVHSYKRINRKFWMRYRKGEIDQQTLRLGRFKTTFDKFQLPNSAELSATFSEAYIRTSPRKTSLFPYA